MNKLSALIATVVLAFTSFTVVAKEPVNIYIVKQQLIQYHDSGEYNNDIKLAIEGAINYLEQRVLKQDFQGKKPAIVLDIDETSLSNFSTLKLLNFGGLIDEFRQYEDKGADTVIEPTLKLYQFAIDHDIDVIFISGRLEFERAITIKNLKAAGFDNWKQLILRANNAKKTSASEYKSAIRKQLIDQGYDILLNVGDQQSDLTGGYADKTIKLPNPFYFIP